MSEDAQPSLYAKLAAVTAEVGYVQKRGRNDFHKYTYVTEHDLIEAVRSKLSERNVVMLPSVVGIDERPVTTAKGAASCITTVRIAFTFADGDSGETHVAEWAGSGDDPADKGLYKAYTGALKYFLMKTFLIATGDDPEADASTDDRSQAGQTRTPATSFLDFLATAVKAKDRKALPAAELLKLQAHASQGEAERKEVAADLRTRLEMAGGNYDAVVEQYRTMRQPVAA